MNRFLTVVCACLTLFASGAELVGEWRLGEGVSREGSKIVVDVPAGKSGAAATASVDLSRFPRGFEARIRCSGRDVTNPPEHWLGLKFMINYKDAKGNDQWPQAAKLSGTFDGAQLRFAHRYPAGFRKGTGTLMLGLQSASGHVVFDLDSLQLAPVFDFRKSVTNADHRCAYTKDLLAAPRRRGAEAVREIDPDVTLVLESNNWDSPPTYEYMRPRAPTGISGTALTSSKNTAGTGPTMPSANFPAGASNTRPTVPASTGLRPTIRANARCWMAFGDEKDTSK